MNYRPVYLDTSAIVKLVIPETGSEALAAWLRGWPDRVTSVLARLEMARLMQRIKAPRTVRNRAADVLDAIAQVRADDSVIDLGATLRDPALRSLDALHLATALSLSDLPEAFVTYDARLARAAVKARLTVVAPI